MGGGWLLSINSGAPINAVPAEARKEKGYDELLYEREDRLTVVVSAQEFRVAYPLEAGKYLKKTADLDGKAWRVGSISDGEWAHEITLEHVDQG